VLVEVSMFPIGKGESVSAYVARALDIIDRSGLDYKLGPMGTTIEGEWDEVFGVIQKCFEDMKQDCNRVEFMIKGDYRKGHENALGSKLEAVEKKLIRRLRK
jgi:uncharacterized protein (TIGR00106 family)